MILCWAAGKFDICNNKADATMKDAAENDILVCKNV
jgi:hypothetical protein